MFNESAARMAKFMANYSPDPSTKVGCVITDPHGRMVGRGFNRLPLGCPHEWYGDRALKNRAIVHAEVMALLDAKGGAQGGLVYCTAHPCRDCAKALIEAGIAVVFCPSEPWRDDVAVRETVDDAKQLFHFCGVEYGGPIDAR